MTLYADFRKDIAYIEKELERSVNSSSPIIQQASLHLLRAGGKRIRPIFVILASKFGTYSLEDVAKVAVSLELSIWPLLSMMMSLMIRICAGV